MVNSIFEPKKSQMKERTLSVKVPEDLHAEIDAIKKTLGEMDSGKRFNVNAICVEAVRKAVKRAKKELAALQNEGRTSVQTAPTGATDISGFS